MSVQAGILNFDGAPVDRAILSRLSHGVADYGPDGEESFFDGSLGMLYRPFHTTVESYTEKQPYVSARGNVVTWDGRLDNRDELLRHVRDDMAVDRTDVAIVAAAFDRCGAKAFATLIGDWAVSIWNREKREIILARDYIGIKQLFYYRRPRRLMWCNRLAPLALCGDQFQLCDEYIAGYFGFWPEAHLTPYRDIHSVGPGEFVVVCEGRVSMHSYWTFNPDRTTRCTSDKEYEEHFLYLFRQSVRRRLRTDKPILAELSGGLDSSSIVCMADDILHKEGPGTPAVDTFSFCDRSEPDDDDAFHFAKVEEQRHRKGHHVELHGTGDTYCFEDSHFKVVPGFTVREELKSAQADVIRRGGYRVVLSGNGGDQVMGRGLDPRVQMADLLRDLRVAALAQLLLAWSLCSQRPWLHLLCQSLVILLPTSLRTLMKPVTHVEPWLNRGFARRHRVTDRLLLAANGPWFWAPTKRYWFQTLRDIAGEMTYREPSVHETRYPFLDQTLTEFLISIPTDQLVRPGQRRSLTRRALVDIVPSDILLRQSKASSGRCDVITLEKHWSKVDALLSSPVGSQLGYLDESGFRSSVEAMKSGKVPPYVVALLRAISLELWLRQAAGRGLVVIPDSYQRGTPGPTNTLGGFAGRSKAQTHALTL